MEHTNKRGFSDIGILFMVAGVVIIGGFAYFYVPQFLVAPISQPSAATSTLPAAPLRSTSTVPTPKPMPTSTETGLHCGGNMANPPACPVGYHCAPKPDSHLPFGDVGGICIIDPSPVIPAPSSTVSINGGPVITTISPSSAPTTTLITITGSHFTPTNNVVNFGSRAGAAYELNSADGVTIQFYPYQVSICAPNTGPCPGTHIAAGTYQIYVSNSNGMSNKATFTVQ